MEIGRCCLACYLGCEGCASASVRCSVIEWLRRVIMTRYLSGLCVAGLGLCGGGWLVAAVAFGGESAGLAGRVNLMTGAGLIAVCCLSLVCWSFAWRQRMRVDGVLADRLRLVSRHEARRNRRALGRDVRRAGKLAERSARDARRAARRSARAG